jgi:hypothetical protein
MIKLRFTTLDGIRKTKKFKTLAGARKAAHDWVGKSAEIGSTYAISGDGVVKVTTEGCSLFDIWPDQKEDYYGPLDDGDGPRRDYESGGGEFDPGADYGPAESESDYWKIKNEDGTYIAKTFQFKEDADQYVYNLGDITYTKPDGSIGSYDFTVECWNDSSGEPVRVLPPKPAPTNDDDIPF